MLRVIELHVEALFEVVRKSFQRWISAVYVRVTDRAHGSAGRDELCPMAFNAVFVAGKAGPRRIIIPVMTTRTTSRSVTLTGVQELRVVEIVSLRVNRGKRQ